MNFEPIFELSDTEKQEFTRRHDLSDIIAEIDVLCFRLDFYEMGRWWDYANARRKLTHPAIIIWMNRHGFNSFADLPTPAIAALCANLKKYLGAAEQASSLDPIKAIEGGKDVAYRFLTTASYQVSAAPIKLTTPIRHPDNVGASADIAREIALNMTEAVCHYVPEARETIEQGWNPAYDVDRDYFDAEF